MPVALALYTFCPMPTIDQHKLGTFCWIELSTTDQEAAKGFYESLFGWTTKDNPAGPNSIYTMFRLGGRDIGGGITLRAELLAAGVPPHWAIYVQVDNADAAAARAAAAGGKILAPAFDILDAGRMSVIQDPTGAVFCIWQPNKSKGIQVAGEPGSLCWADLNTHDPERAQEFYADVFGWTFEADKLSAPPSGYVQVKNGGQFIGGIPRLPRSAQIPPHWMVYFLVSDLDASAALAKQLGATFCMEPTVIQKVGRFAILVDPQGAVFAIFEPLPTTR